MQLHYESNIKWVEYDSVSNSYQKKFISEYQHTMHKRNMEAITQYRWKKKPLGTFVTMLVVGILLCMAESVWEGTG